MDTNHSIKLFEDKKVRVQWVEEEEFLSSKNGMIKIQKVFLNMPLHTMHATVMFMKSKTIKVDEKEKPSIIKNL